MATALSRLSGRVWIYPGDPDPAAVKPRVAVVTDDAGCTVVDLPLITALLAEGFDRYVDSHSPSWRPPPP